MWGANQPMTLQLIAVHPEHAGQRIDSWLTAQLPDRSRSEIQRWIKEERVAVRGACIRASYRLEAGDQVAVDLPDSAPQTNPASADAEDIPLHIVYEDDDLLVIDKPAGMVVHPAPGHSGGTLVNAVLHHAPGISGVGGEQRPGIVHRLDKETSGLIIVAKHDRAHRHLQAQFKQRTIYKEYVALVEGGLQPPAGRISAPIGRHPVDRKRQAVLPTNSIESSPKARDAVTEYHTMATFHLRPPGMASHMTFTLLRIVLHTGRTHQIRVHLAWRKHPVVGDTLYGPPTPRLPIARQFLHAQRLRLRLPTSGEEREFVAPLPEDLKLLLDSLQQKE